MMKGEAPVSQAEGDVQLLPGSTPGPRARVSITPIISASRELIIPEESRTA